MASSDAPQPEPRRLVILEMTPEDRDAWLAAVPEPPVDNPFDSQTMLRALSDDEATHER